MAHQRVCRSCRTSKPREEFYTHRNDRPYLDCKDCWKAYVRSNRLERREHYRAYDLARIDDPNRKAMRDAYRARLPKEYKNAKAKEWIERNPDKRAAHIALGNAVRDGKVFKPDICERCGASGCTITAHHPDYSKPLEVEWLCRPCHGREHRLPR